MFSGAAVLTPYYRCWTEKLYDCSKLISILDAVNPNYSFPMEFTDDYSPEWMAKWGELLQDKIAIKKFTARGAKVWIDE